MQPEFRVGAANLAGFGFQDKIFSVIASFQLGRSATSSGITKRVTFASFGKRNPKAAS